MKGALEVDQITGGPRQKKVLSTNSWLQLSRFLLQTVANSFNRKELSSSHIVIFYQIKISILCLLEKVNKNTADRPSANH